MNDTIRKRSNLTSLVIGCALLALAGCHAGGHHGRASAARGEDSSWQLPDVERESRVRTSQVLEFPADQVWELIAGFDTLPDYMPGVVGSELRQGGAVRHVILADGGGVVVERLVYFNEATRTFSYTIIDLIDCDLAMRNYQARVHLTSTGPTSCLLEWESSFDVEGASREETEELARAIYEGCYEGINRALGGG
jgi:hypothetical protein